LKIESCTCDFKGKSKVRNGSREYMIERRLQIDNELDGSIFLFGARQTGKSTILRQQFPKAIYIDLLDTEMKARFSRRPVLLYEMLNDKRAIAARLRP
jgi:predicted AAA+ superfamily ATPase